MQSYEILELGDVMLQRGTLLPNAKLAYKTIGRLNAEKSNVVLCPTWFTGYVDDVAAVLTGEGRALDPARYFIVIPALLGMGESSSPSNTLAPFDHGRFPHVTLYDNVRFQHRLLTEHLGIKEIALATSWSLGGAQAYQWAAQYPDMVKAIAPIACAAKTGIYNQLFIKSNIKALVSDPEWNDGWYGNKPPIKGIRVLAHIFAGWAMSEEFYRTETFKLMGHATLDDFLVDFWEAYFCTRDANNMMAQMYTSMTTDISAQPAYRGDLDRALGAIKARLIALPSQTDQYFPPVDTGAEVERISNAEQRTIPSIFGHFAPFDPAAQQFIDVALRELLHG